MLRSLSVQCRSASDDELDALLARCNRNVKLAILVAESQESVEVCEGHLHSAGGFLTKALAAVHRPNKETVGETATSRQFSLCIDGGGTKCAAAVIDSAGAIYRGSAGPCNLTDCSGDIDGVISTILEATKSAVADQTMTGADRTEPWREYLKTCFSSIWVGLAGLDRAGFQSLLRPKLAEAFGIVDPENVRVTSDVDLLAAAVPLCHEQCSALIVIAGTGSIAMRYKWVSSQREHVRVARSGGWGHILGDEGGGYAIGLKAIQHTLSIIEGLALGLVKSSNDELAMAVSTKLGCDLSSTAGMDILNDLLARGCTQSAKRRIAGVAEAVLGLMKNCQTAADIVRAQIAKLVGDTLKKLVNPKSLGYQPTEHSVLILAGGLLNNKRYRAVFEDQLNYHRLYFRGTVLVDDAAALGAESLRRCIE